MRLIDADALLDKQESLYMRGHVLFHGVTAFAIENAPTILPTSAKWEKTVHLPVGWGLCLFRLRFSAGYCHRPGNAV